jgi:hypothetical protein
MNSAHQLQEEKHEVEEEETTSAPMMSQKGIELDGKEK